MQSVLQKLGLTDDNAGVFDGEWRGGGAKIDKISPINGQKLASVRTASADDYDRAISRAHEAFLKWRTTPGPVRGDTVRRLGNALREFKHDLGQLVTLETGKDYRRRRRRSAGDDRYLRLRGWSVAHALWPDDSIGTAQSPFDGAMASTRRCRGYHRLQFSGRGLVVERSPRRRLWRRDCLESFGKNAAYCDCSDENCRASFVAKPAPIRRFLLCSWATARRSAKN